MVIPSKEGIPELELVEKGHLLRKRGFYITLGILPNGGKPIKMSEFFAELIKSAYYNLFLRIKPELLKKNIIEIAYNQKPRCIKLTKNGVVLKHLLKELIDQIDKGVDK